MKSNAWMRKGVSIHCAVSSAHRKWSSSNKKKKVDKSVRISTKPSITLKNVNLSTANILLKGHWNAIRLRNGLQNPKRRRGFQLISFQPIFSYL